MAPVCDLIIRPRPSATARPPTSTQVLLQPQNLAKLYQAGFDIEVAYTTRWTGCSPAWKAIWTSAC